ncbi:MAG TPA: alpha/beta hydrolase-fold protein [Saprospiraceae bacterium]
MSARAIFKCIGVPMTICFWMIVSIASIHAQLTITVTSVPPNTPPDSTIYIAGNFNDWDPGNEEYALTNHQNGTYSITFFPNPGTLEFKFTRGSWATVEGNAAGGFRPNRTLQYNGGAQQNSMTIDGWEDITGKHTATPNVQILDEDYYIPQLDRFRRVWIYLPPDYNSTSKRYPVIYMHDGQNVFDAFYSFAGEWKVDESMNELFNLGDYGAIVVAVDNGGGERTNEYSPWINPGYGGGKGEAYATFLATTLKPHIDSTFRTLPGREYTAIAGSSLGGNISMYTAIEYQDVFGKAGIFSPAFWFSDSSYIHLSNKGITEDLRVYFIAGENESSTIIEDMEQMYDALVSAGQDPSEMYLISEPDGAHSEWFWAREYPDCYEWLFDELILADQSPENQYWSVYPNPVKDFLYLSNDPDDLSYSIILPTGQYIQSGSVLNGKIDTSALTTGLYILQLMDTSGYARYTTRFIKS